MSSSAVINEVSTLLRALPRRRAEVSGESESLGGTVQSSGTRRTRKLCRFGYTRSPANGYLRNIPNVRTPDEAERFPPLSLDLCYLLTPSQKNEGANQATLAGRCKCSMTTVFWRCTPGTTSKSFI